MLHPGRYPARCRRRQAGRPSPCGARSCSRT